MKKFNFKTLLLAIGLTVASVQTWGAVSVKNTSYVYFNPSASSWDSYSYIYLTIDDKWGWQMKSVSNTKLRVCSTDEYNNSGIRLFAVGTTWGDKNTNMGGWENMKNNASNITDWYGSDWTFKSNEYNILTLNKQGSVSSLATITPTYLGNSIDAMNKTQTIKAKVSTDGGSNYSEVTTSPGTLSASSKKFSDYKTCGTTTSLSSGEIICGYTATTTLTAADATGYTFVAWYKGSSQVSTNKSIRIYPTDDATYYAYYKANGYQVEFDGNGATSGSMNNEQYYYGVSQALTANAFERTNYNFVGWNTDKDATTVLYTDKKSVSNLSSTDGDVVTLYAIWALDQVDVTYGVFGSAHGTIRLGSNTPISSNTTTKVDGGSAVTFTATPATGYTVEGWYDNSDCTGSKLQEGVTTGGVQTYTTPALTGNTTVYVKFVEINYNITLSKGTGISDIQVAGVTSSSVTAHVDTKTGNITAVPSTGYSWKEWTITSGSITATPPDLTTNGIQINATSTGELTATATEILHSVSVASNDVNKGTVNVASVSNVGIAAKSANITATPKPGYYFTGWDIPAGVTLAQGYTQQDATIKINATADSRAITANFANRYAFRGSLNDQGNTPAGMPGWGSDALITFTEGTGTVQYTLQPNKQYKFLIYDLKNSQNRGFTSSDQTFSWNGTATFDGTCHALLNTRGTGTYTFTITMSGDNPRVTLAGQTSYQITFGKGTGGSTITAASSNDGTITSGQYVKTGSTVTFTQTPSTGYEFKGWYTSPSGSTAVDGITTAGVMANVTADKQVYAQYKPITYNITYPASPEHYTINTEAPKTADYKTSPSFTVTPDKGYLVDVTAIKTGGATSVTLQRNGNTYTISSMPAYDVTINVTAHKFYLNGWGESSSDKEFDANWEYKAELNALTPYEFKLHNTATGLSNNGYFGNNGTIESTITSGWTMSDNEGTKLKLKTGIAGTYTFTYCEVEENGVMKPQIKVTFPQVSKLVYNGTDYPFTDLGNGTWKAGPLSLAANTTLSNNIQMYWEGTCIKNNYDGTMSASSHTDWVMERYTSGGPYYIMITTAGDNSKTFAKNPDNYYFYYKPDGKKLTAEYPSYWRGDDIGWDYNHPMEFVNDVATIEMDVQTSGDREMKVIVDGQYWTYEGTKISTSTNDIQFVKDDQANKNAFKFNVASSMKGIYTFTFNRATHKMSVGYPDTEQFDITYTDAEGTKTIKAGPNGGRGISAANKPGYKFVRWDLDPDDTDVIDVAGHDLTLQTTTVYGKAAGGSITAIYTNEHFIYFKNIPNWGNVYVQFYSNPYFHGDDAEKDKNCGTGTGGDGNTSLVNNTIYQMTRIDKTDIWYFDYSDFASAATNKHTVAFTDSKQDDHDFFDQCQVVYRGDFGECAPMMVPINYIDQYLNQHDNQRTCYYGQGHWMKYDAAENEAMGIKLHIYNWNESSKKWEDIANSPYDFLADNDGSYSSHASGINLPSANYKYHVKLEGCATGGTWYGNTGKMTSAECTNWVMSINTNDMEFEAKSAGPYTFRLTTGDGQLKLSAEYPLVEGDFRVVKTNNSQTYNTGLTYKCANTQADTASFYYNSTTESGYTFKVQKCTSAANNTWADVSGATFTNPTQTGIYNFIFSHEGENVTIQKTEPYTGKFYIRTEGVDGGMESYKGNADNEMTYYGSMLDAGATYSNFQYNYYKAKWIWSGKDVTFCIANDYSKHISGDFTTDAILNSAKLPQNTNVRFMWNSQTNELKRAYISGSAIDADKFLMLLCENEKMFNLSDESITELKFTDKNNWVYQADIKAQPGCEVKLTAQYNSKVQYFIGSETTTRKIIDGDGTNKYTLRAVYDFKTNRLVAGWIPSGTIENNIELGSDMLIERVGQDDASQIVFGGAEPSSLSISEIQHIYGVLKLRKATMVGATETDYDKCIYWISFPFDVKVSEIFGVEKYGEVWVISNYRGDLRAQKGWFKQDTQTFWEFLKPSDIMKANVGYTLNLDPDYFNKDSSEPWKNSATEVAWYFPSTEENIGVVSLAQKDTVLPAQHCTIDRTFETEDKRTLNHKFTDSNWRVIGVPAFQNLQSPTFNPVPSDDETGFGLKGFYEWDSEHNTYTARSASEYTFKATGAYMVQYEGKITWSNAAVITTGNKAPWHAPEYTYADAKNYSITLEFGNDDYTDQTFVTLIEKASTDFVLNEDMMKIDNAGFPNIYSFAGAYDVAYNETTFDNQTVLLGVSAPKNGSYTFAMPKDFSGKAVLVDLESGEATDLNLSDYTVELNKGTYNNRFQLLLEVEAQSPTNINPTKGEWSEDGKTKKLFINDNIYLINGGRIYNVLGVGE